MDKKEASFDVEQLSIELRIDDWGVLEVTLLYDFKVISIACLETKKIVQAAL